MPIQSKAEIRESIHQASVQLKTALVLKYAEQDAFDNMPASPDRDKCQLHIQRIDDAIDPIIRDLNKSWIQFDLTN